MPNTVVTNIDAVLNTAVTSTGTLATVDTADLAEIFDITPTKSAGKVAILINNTSATGTVTFSLAAGDFFASVAALTGSVLASTSKLIQVDTAKYKKSTGKLALTVTPSSGAKLKTGNVVMVQAIQLI